MLLLPAAALCCLCSALVSMAADLIQNDASLTRRVGGHVSFSCGGVQQCGENYVCWYQKKDKDTFKVILDIDKRNGNIDKSYSSHPQKDDFSAVKAQNDWELELKTVKEDHSATYYCSCWPGSHTCFTVWDVIIFGPGTKLIVTEQQVVLPVVSVYPAAPTGRPEGSSSLLCLASDMLPPLVRFSWKRQKENGSLEELHPAEGEQLELRETGHSAAILFVQQQESSSYKYSCFVNHEGVRVKAQTEQELPAAASCPPEREPADLPAVQLTDWSFQSQCRVKLLLLLYTVLIVKSLLYCCGLSLLMIG
ncbi:immunoglobulin lambda-1 light chain-like [Parambassis ranga]|uniref:immunoglobulin lambda-1 light chain-like n=1 Tax=Parambassis ranga TaxID=210632 RepID=UPI001041D44F|nr:immunoglobulin lambda-1 light chain-like [Parambassis ranga]